MLHESGVPEAQVFDQARITLTWRYQWVVVHNFLLRLVGAELFDDVLSERNRRGGGAVRAVAPPTRRAT